MKNTRNKNNGYTIGHYLSPYKGPIVLYVFLMMLGSFLDIFKTLTIANMIELVTVGKFTTGIYYILGLIGFTLIQRACWFSSACLYSRYSNKVTFDINMDLSKQAFRLDSKTYNDHDTGTFTQRIVSDPQQIMDNLSRIVDMVTMSITSIIMLVYIITLNVWIALIFITIAIIASFIEKGRLKKRKVLNWDNRKKFDRVNSLTNEIVRSEKDIKSLGLESKLSEVSNKYYQNYLKSFWKMYMSDNVHWSVRNTIINIFSYAALILGIVLMEKALLTLSAFIIIYSNREILFDLVYSIGNIADIVQNIKIGQKRMFSLFDEDEFVTEKFGNKHFDNLNGDIEFRNVSYTFKEYEYPDQLDKEKIKKEEKKEKKLISENKVLDKLSFVIKPNTTVAFVGKSGSGKSTILNLMSKMYDADEGQVLIDGQDIKTLDKETLRNTISLVNQFPYIFDMTIKENLLLAKPNASDEELQIALKKSSLEDFVNTLPNKLNTKVGESGIKLSGGQKQRLAIARAMLRNSNILIFDESTSSLDNFAQGEIKQSIDKLKGKSTIVIVAHRLSTIKDADKIFFLDKGKIVDSGTFDELFETNETFKTMFLAENI